MTLPAKRLDDGPIPPGRRIAIVHPFGGGGPLCRLSKSEIHIPPRARPNLSIFKEGRWPGL